MLRPASEVIDELSGLANAYWKLALSGTHQPSGQYNWCQARRLEIIEADRRAVIAECVEVVTSQDNGATGPCCHATVRRIAAALEQLAEKEVT